MFLRQIPAVAASVLLGVGLAQVDDAQRGTDVGHRAIRGSPHVTIAPTPNHNSSRQGADVQSAGGARPNDDGYEMPRGGGRRRWAHRWNIDGDYGDGPYGLGGPLVYWAPGRWYPYPGFGDKRFRTPQPEGVWSR